MAFRRRHQELRACRRAVAQFPQSRLADMPNPQNKAAVLRLEVDGFTQNDTRQVRATFDSGVASRRHRKARPRCRPRASMFGFSIGPLAPRFLDVIEAGTLFQSTAQSRLLEQPHTVPTVRRRVCGSQHKRFGPRVHHPAPADAREFPGALGRVRNELGEELCDKHAERLTRNRDQLERSGLSRTEVGISVITGQNISVRAGETIGNRAMKIASDVAVRVKVCRKGLDLPYPGVASKQGPEPRRAVSSR